MMNPTEVLQEYDSYAVVGATQRKKKYGYKIYKTILNYGKKAFPVNPRYDSVDGAPCYPSITELPDKPAVVVSVVPPRVTDKLIDECKKLGINILWMQPGTYNDDILKKCEDKGIEPVYGACIMLKLDG
jgi:predicted CoA-binding protein